MGRVEERSVDVDGVETFYRRTDGEVGDAAPVLFVHGNPTHSEDWMPFLERIRGPAIAPDLPGWGRSESPRELDYSMHGLSRFVGRFLDVLAIRDYVLVVHDWGGLALITAQAEPARVRRLAVINAVPLLPGYRWHWIARWFWRRRGLGELFNATANKPGLKLISRQASARPGPMDDEFVDMVWRHRGRGTWKPMLDLYRSADPVALEEAGGGLEDLTCPALVVWGQNDHYLPPHLGRMYAQRLPNAELLAVPDAGHWPWIDDPSVIDRVVEFLDRG
jgi:pimeloyl-ACP methyl ester carboxylesterase